jgi:flagellar basal body-associated protein FliL
MNVLSVGYFSNNKEIKQAVLKSDQIRNKALKLCTQTAGYETMTLEQKNKLYDSIVSQLKEGE